MDENDPKDEIFEETLDKPDARVQQAINEEREAKTEERREESRAKRKKYIIWIVVIVFFVTGFNVGKSIKINKEVEESNKTSKQGYEERLQRLSNTEAAYGALIDVDKDKDLGTNEVENPRVESELLTFARYEIKNETDKTKGCGITVGSGNNFSIYLSEDAYIYGSYNVEGKTLICNAETYRDNEEEVITINTTVVFQIVDKQTLRVASVEFGDSEEVKDSEIISLNGLKTGQEYEYKAKNQ